MTWGWPKNGLFWTKNGQTGQAWQHFKVVQMGPEGTKMVNLSVFDHLEPLLDPSGPFWTISDKNDFFAPNGQNRVLQRCFGAEYKFLFEMVQKGPDGPLSCHEWQGMGTKEVFYSYLVPGWSGKSFMKIGCWEVPKPSYLPFSWSLGLCPTATWPLCDRAAAVMRNGDSSSWMAGWLFSCEKSVLKHM